MKRYRLILGQLVEHPDGEWVQWEDVVIDRPSRPIISELDMPLISTHPDGKWKPPPRFPSTPVQSSRNP